jgi:hypothetical protein
MLMSKRTSAGVALLAAAALLFAAPDAAAACDPSVELVISEFMAANDHTLADDDGEFTDWIEIYNPCLPAIDLAGWSLTDDPADLTKWRFPAVTLERGDSLLVFASGKNRAVAGQVLHASFKLDAGGEYLALVKPDGTTIAQEFAPQYLAQVSDTSYGFEQSAAQHLAKGSPAAWHVPAADDATLGNAWTEPGFDAAAWPSGPTGLGFTGDTTTGFTVTWYKANVTVGDLATAEAVVVDPALQSSVVEENAAVVNYINTGATARYAADRPFPGTTIGVDVNDFVVLVTGHVIIPTAGPWTFGVSSDDGFSLQLSREPDLFESSFPGQRGASDTLATFDITTPGAYELRLIMYERGGGSELELFAAPGTHASWSAAAFDLVGDTANGGLAVNGLVSEIGTDTGIAMRGVNASLWARLEFEVPDPAAVGLLILRMEYEDGFVAWLNGQEVASRNAPSPAPWDAAATADRPIEIVAAPERIDLTGATGLLLPGTNVLALHGLNDAASDPDFLVLPDLQSIGAAFDPAAPRFFTTPTPGRINRYPGYPGVSAVPLFSRASATFASDFTLTLSTLAPDGVIRYTTNGSDPTETNGTIYSAPVAIANSTRVRARVFQPGLAPGPVVSRLYAKLDPSVLTFNSNLPIVVVHTFGSGIAQDWLTETLTSVIDTTAGRATITDQPDFVGPAGIRIRGSSSTQFPKKQYALETWDDDRKDREVAFLDLPPESDWILYAPYSEKALIQNALAYGWYRATGRYAVRTRFCEMYLRTGTGAVASADYAGIYIVMEKIKQGPDRVAITELLPGDETPPAVTGGYIFKKDRLDPGDLGFVTSRGQKLAYVDPKEVEITTAQAAWLRNFLDTFEAVLYGPDFADPATGYAAYIDPLSFVDHHILVELTKNIDGFRLSSFFFKDRLGKLNMGPVWDYNLSLGNANYLDGWKPAGWYHDLISDTDYPYFRRLFADPEFAQLSADRWFELRRGPFSTTQLLADYDGAIALLQEAAPRNFARWPILGKYVWPNWYIGTSWEDDVAWNRQWLVDRIAWIDAQFPAPPVFSQQGGSVPIGYNLSIGAATGAIWYTLDGSDPRAPGGAIAPGALPYAGPLVVLSSIRVRTRALDGTTWSALNDASFEPVPVAVVNEVLADNGAGLADELGEFEPWIELYNPASAPADLGGMFLSDDPADPAKWAIPTGSEICGHDRLLVFADGEPGEGPLHADFRLGAGAGTVFLYDAAGVLVSSLARPALPRGVSYGRLPDGGTTLTRFLRTTPGTANAASSTPIHLNEYNGVSPTKYLAGTASDPYFGRVPGNGGDWFELAVVQDHLDLRGWQVVVRDMAGLAGDTTQTLTFSDHPVLSDLRSGTIVTVAADLASNASYDPLADDWWLHLRSGAAGDGLYISALPFSVSNDYTQISVLDAHGVAVFGPAGEGINPASGIGSDEVFKLESDPGPGVTASANYKDGTSSTFGAPNLWSGGTVTQNFGALRAPVTRACSLPADCDDANPCTDDECSGGHCVNAPNAAPCDDGNPCTSGDACAARACRGAVTGNCCLGACACDDLSPCSIDACSPLGCTHDPTCALGGTVRYYRDAAAFEPSAKGVPGVGIDLSDDGLADATTGDGGAYLAGDRGGRLRVEALPRLGVPRAADHNGAVSSFDAALVARASVGALELSPNQQQAGDVTGNGEASSLDAARIAQFAAQLIDHFEVAAARNSDWRFLRCDSYAGAADPACGEPLFAHDPLLQPETDDFYAILYGDVSGNWMPAAGEAGSLAGRAPGAASAAASVTAPAGSSPEEIAAVERDRAVASWLAGRPRARIARPADADPAVLGLDAVPGRLARGERRRLLVRLDGAEGIESLDLRLVYPGRRLAIVGVEATGIGSNLAIAWNDTGDELRLGLYGVEPLAGSGAVVAITVEARRALSRLPPLGLEARANEGAIRVRSAGRLRPPAR